MAQPLVNGVAYHWATVEVNIFNQAIAGITSIEYDDDQEMQDNYGAGIYPVSRSYGKVKASAKLTLEMAEVVALQKAVPSGRIQDIAEFDVVVTYATGLTVVTDTIKNCRFMKNARAPKSGSAEGIMVDIPLITSHIEWGK
jgi:hypothetical protein